MSRLGFCARGIGCVAFVALVAMVVVAPVAEAAKIRTPVGYDVSYPQCNQKLPSAAFGIVGVNGGIVFSKNPCLGTGDGPSELAWAQQANNPAPAFYANTGNPGPAYSSHWPTGQSAPQTCETADNNSSSCAFDYGWNAAQDSFADAAAAEQQVNGLAAADAMTTAAHARWWLDVETGNSWETLESAYGQTATAKANDVAALDGAIAYLTSVGVSEVGFYSTSYQWTQITGGTGAHFARQSDWPAGFSSQSTARAACGTSGFAGGVVTLAQYHANGLDADVAC